LDSAYAIPVHISLAGHRGPAILLWICLLFNLAGLVIISFAGYK
jgi:hypothetical protein